MTTWEYDKVDLNSLARKTEDVDLLNEVGREGWELVHITSNNIAYLKRPIEEDTPAKVTPPRAPKRSSTPATAG